MSSNVSKLYYYVRKSCTVLYNLALVMTNKFQPSPAQLYYLEQMQTTVVLSFSSLEWRLLCDKTAFSLCWHWPCLAPKISTLVRPLFLSLSLFFDLSRKQLLEPLTTLASLDCLLCPVTSLIWPHKTRLCYESLKSSKRRFSKLTLDIQQRKEVRSYTIIRFIVEGSDFVFRWQAVD